MSERSNSALGLPGAARALLLRAVVLLGFLGATQGAAAQQQLLERYEAHISDPNLSKEVIVGASTWRCEAGVCTAMGRGGRVSLKGCVRFAVNLGVEVTHYQLGANALSAADIARCQEYVRTKVTQRPQELTPPEAGQLAYDLTADVGQGLSGDGGVRMVFREGGVVLLLPDGKLFEFDEDRRLVRRGQFIRWQSRRGDIVGTVPITDAVRARCAHSTLRVELQPGQMGGNQGHTALCYPQIGSVLLHYEPVPAFAAADERRAIAVAFRTPHVAEPEEREAFAIKVSDFQRRAQVRSGSIGVSRPYARETAVAIDAVRDAALACYRWVLGRSTEPFQGQGELLLSLGQAGNQRTALILRYTYPHAPRLNACIEQTVFQAQLPDLGAPIRLNVPFDLLLEQQVNP